MSLFFSIILIAGCVTAPKKPLQPKVTEKTYNYPKKNVWKTLITVLVEMGAGIETMDKESGLLSTGEVGIPTKKGREIVILPSFHLVAMTVFYEANYQLNILVSAVNNMQTKVNIKPGIRMKSEGWFVFESNGTLESEIFAMVDNKLKKVVKTKTSTKKIQPTASHPSPPPSEKSDSIYLITLKNSNIRTAPTTKSQIISTIKKGTKLEKISESRDWFKVKLPSGETGYVYKPLVAVIQ